jgi:hypothetical protein
MAVILWYSFLQFLNPNKIPHIPARLEELGMLDEFSQR